MIRKRKTIRLKHFDYAQGGYYFITICTQNRQCFFGEDGVGAGLRADPKCNAAGHMIKSAWHQIPHFYNTVELDEFVVMPNHIHGIIKLNGRPQRDAPTISDIMNRFKSYTTAHYCYGVKHNQWQSFDGKLWQRSFYDHVIRNDFDLLRVRQYIRNNPIKWDMDRNNPKNVT